MKIPKVPAKHEPYSNASIAAREEETLVRAKAAADPADLSILPTSSGGRTRPEAQADENRLALETAAANLGVTAYQAARIEKANCALAMLNATFGLSYYVSKFSLSTDCTTLYAPDKTPVPLGSVSILVVMKNLIERAKKAKAATISNQYRAQRSLNQSKKGYLTNV